MNLINNQRGIALVTALMFTLISLAIIMTLLYFMTQGIQASASHKRYKTALEASYGGAEIVLKEVIPQIFQGYSSSQLNTAFSGIGMHIDATTSCLKLKLTTPTSKWPSSCSQTLDPKSSSDLNFTLQAQGASSAPFTVYSKIVDTVTGNTDTSGLQLEGSGVAEAGSIVTPQHFPYFYRVEVQGERSTHATEHANLDIQYAY
jgi:hypothetical protein